MQQGMKIREYVSKVEYVSKQLSDVGCKVDEESLIGKIISGLLPEYKQFMTGWLATDERQRNFMNLLPRLLAGESALNQPDEEKSVALNVRAARLKGSNGRDKKVIECYYCHKKGHYKRQCRSFKRDQASNGTQSKVPVSDNSDEPTPDTKSINRALAMTTASRSEDRIWYLDSAASAHMS